ncbi:MAG: hypothetical protein ACT4QC_00975 [Planctomycetaceae bacterium]
MEQADLVKYAIGVLEQLRIPYLIVGSLASGAYGEPRYTADIDIVVDLEAEKIEPLCDAFPTPEFYVSRDAALDAVRRRRQFNVIHTVSANKIDFMISRRDAWSQQQLARRRREQVFEGIEGFTASPEDIIISKMNYYREGGSEKHTRDITGMLKVSGDRIDREYIADWAGQLELTEIWTTILARLEQGLSKEPQP